MIDRLRATLTFSVMSIEPYAGQFPVEVTPFDLEFSRKLADSVEHALNEVERAYAKAMMIVSLHFSGLTWEQLEPMASIVLETTVSNSQMMRRYLRDCAPPVVTDPAMVERWMDVYGAAQ